MSPIDTLNFSELNTSPTAKPVFSVVKQKGYSTVTISGPGPMISVPVNGKTFVAALSVRFVVGVSLLLAPAGADQRGPKASFPLVQNAGKQPAIRKRVPAGAPAGARSY